ncbi:MAG: tRNA preQ1(34) S-adenosylmethionine ribosyltransferase-isomerase QueA [Oscillospiraceae bacterium]
MIRSDFFYNLPKELIAQHPAIPRDSSKLLCLDKKTGCYSDSTFTDIEDMLDEKDLLVVNDSKVIPARLLGTKRDTGASAELLLLKRDQANRWECLARPGKRLKKGHIIDFGDALSALIVDETEDGNRIVEFSFDTSRPFFELLDQIGKMPLPPYITEPIRDNSEYQTVYANELGSAAAPTAGLHFTDELLERIKARGTRITNVTLHVGLGTFRPVKENDITQHKMHSEFYSVSEKTAELINDTKKNGGRVICVGTTSCRTLESVAQRHGSIVSCAEDTEIFIYPGYEFKVMDGLITNFHLPESTLIMLVSAFAGYENTMKAYEHAVAQKYRFFSFGDAMFIS